MFWLAFFQFKKKKRPHSKLKWENMASWFWILLFIIAKCFNPGQLDLCSLAFRCSSSLLKGSVTTFLDWCTYNMMFISSDFVKSVAEINRSDLRELDICQDNCVYLCFSLRPSVYSSMKFPSAPSLWSRNDLNLANSINFAFLLFSRSNSWGLIPLSPPRIQISTLLPDRQGYKRSPNAAAPQYLQPSAAINKLHVMHEKEDIVALPNSKWQDYVENSQADLHPICMLSAAGRAVAFTAFGTFFHD